MIDAKYVYRLLNYKIDFKHWIKDVMKNIKLNKTYYISL